ncbi:hypothetical protein VMCG_05218 [Cytospora schulzeri]|uniref:Peptidase C14 caspase domain-containing protein n=1 Tax=Cytospora schulzeri TaxID=448051 RepID=A0A423WQD0_9PEZI|nr:hypothetical protein VMCG_05218 [Valsa malicola]
MATHWAILIGVGMTVDTTQRENGQPEDRSLRGAVPDVQATEAFLRTLSRPVDITTLTASKSPQSDLSSRPSETPEALPTRKNVLDALKRVANSCAAGHQVYIHFSGHGTRRPVPDLYKRSWESVALVLFSDRPEGREYLFAETMHKYLRMITLKGAYVTLVLDCCFSGSVMRTEAHLDSLIRFIEYDIAETKGATEKS